MDGLILTLQSNMKIIIDEKIEIYQKPMSMGDGSYDMPKRCSICINAPKEIRIRREFMDPILPPNYKKPPIETW